MNSTFVSIAQALLAAVIIAGVVYKFFLADDSPTRKTVIISRELGVSGTVTGYNRARKNNIYLNHNTAVPYSFSAFENNELAPDQGLGNYVEMGDEVSKQPNSDTITLQRKGKVSKWHFVPPAAPE